MGSLDDIMSAFRNLEGLVEVPQAWRTSLAESPTATCWFSAHISCQVRFLKASLISLVSSAGWPSNGCQAN